MKVGNFKCGLYAFTTINGDYFIYEIKKGHYEFDIFCPLTMEHLYSIIVEGEHFSVVEYGGKGVSSCSQSGDIRLTLISSPS